MEKLIDKPVGTVIKELLKPAQDQFLRYLEFQCNAKGPDFLKKNAESLKEALEIRFLTPELVNQFITAYVQDPQERKNLEDIFLQESKK